MSLKPKVLFNHTLKITLKLISIFLASKRVGELAEPSARRTAKSATADLKENPFSVSPTALKTKASKRTNELATPKEYENKHIRDNPYAISKSALTCKAKPRTNELAKPRKR